MTNHGEIVASRKSKVQHPVETVFIQNRAHIEVVGHDEALKPQPFTQQFRHDSMTERGGRFFGLKARIPSVTNHHAIHDLFGVTAGEGAKHGELFPIQLFAGAINFRQTVVSVDDRSGIAGKMFTAAGYRRCSQTRVKRTGVPDDLLDRLPITTPA